MLACGHRCPSLCGESCGRQVCPQCATPDQKEQVVDMILSTTLEDIDLTDSGLDNILITLPCKHTFTVETLDGVCGLRDYYKYEDDCWIKPTLPPPGSVLSPVCPQCRGEISSPRYGRVLKRCNLDLLERTVATETANELRSISNAQANIDASLTESKLLSFPRTNPNPQVDAAKLLIIQGAYQDHLSTQSNKSRPFKPEEFFGRSLHEDFGILYQDVDAWQSTLSAVRDLYGHAYRVCCKRSAHRTAYESGLSRLYRQELETISASSTENQRARHDALKSAKVTVGLTPPLADLRFRVEAIWITIDLRLMMASIATALQGRVAKEAKDSTPVLTRMLSWMNTTASTKSQGEIMKLFVQFIYDTCEIDAKLALQTAENSGAHRQILKSELKLLRIALAEFNFKVRLLEGESATTAANRRQELAKIANDKHREASAAMNRAMETYFRLKGRTPAEIDWVKDSFRDTADEILKQWVNIIASLRRGTFYQPVSIEERRQVQQAFNFSKSTIICPSSLR